MALTALLAALAAGVLLSSPGRTHRLETTVRPQAGRLPAAPSAARDPGRSPVDLPQAACVLAGLAAVVLVGGVPGLVLGGLTALAGPRALAGLERSADRVERERFAADLPLALDLLAACLAGGAPLPQAVTVVAAALPGPCGVRLARVAAGLAVGSAAADAWAPLLELEDPSAPVAAPVVRTLVRSSEGGAPVAAAVARVAAESRAAARGRAEQAARRAGVLAVAPLGLCFLPAFVLLGVVPVVVGLAGPLLATF